MCAGYLRLHSRRVFFLNGLKGRRGESSKPDLAYACRSDCILLPVLVTSMCSKDDASQCGRVEVCGDVHMWRDWGRVFAVQAGELDEPEAFVRCYEPPPGLACLFVELFNE